MGWSVFGMAVKGVAQETLLAALSLEPEPEGFVFPVDHVAGARRNAGPFLSKLPNGWLLLCSREWDYFSPPVLEAASRGGEAVAFQMSETVMFSASSSYVDGRFAWSTLHYLDEDKELDVEGDPPAALDTLKAKYDQLQAEDDGSCDYLFDIPLELFRSVCGYRIDDLGEDMEEPIFAELRPIGGVVAKRGLLSRFRQMFSDRGT